MRLLRWMGLMLRVKHREMSCKFSWVSIFFFFQRFSISKKWCFLKIFQQNSEGTITFKLVPSDGKMGQRESKVRVRAHFDYDPESDPYIPCKEAGQAFQRGDILHIVAQVSLFVPIYPENTPNWSPPVRMMLSGGKLEKRVTVMQEQASFPAEIFRNVALFTKGIKWRRIRIPKVCHFPLNLQLLTTAMIYIFFFKLS